jgi:hypothetical protein
MSKGEFEDEPSPVEVVSSAGATTPHKTELDG